MGELFKPPVFEALLSNKADEATGDPILWFRAEDDNEYQIQIRRGVVGMAVATLISLSQGARESGRDVEFQSLSMKGIQKTMDALGRPGLVMYFDGGLELHILIPPKALSLLRNELAELETMSKSSGTT